MALSSYPFDGQTTTENQFSKLFRELQDNGVVSSADALDFKVSADASGMNVKVAAGYAIVRGHAVESTAIETVAIAASGTQQRIDRVVLRLDPANNTITLAVVQGSAGGSAPVLTQTDTGIFEISLATVTVAANVTNIAASAVTDERKFVGGRVSVWSTANRPTTPRRGALGFNVSSSIFEFWTGSAWSDLLDWAKISGKPATYPPSAHTHDPSGYSVAYAVSAGNADTVDGQHASAFAAAGHGHSHVPNADYASNANYANSAGYAPTNSHSHGEMVPSGSYTMTHNFPFIMPNLTVGSTYTVTLSSSFTMQRSSSSRRYKKDIEDLAVAVADLYALRPVQYRYDNAVEGVESDGRLMGGFIAEEVAEVLPVAVIRTPKGVIEDIDTRAILAAAVAMIRDLNARVTELEAMVTT